MTRTHAGRWTDNIVVLLLLLLRSMYVQYSMYHCRWRWYTCSIPPHIMRRFLCRKHHTHHTASLQYNHTSSVPSITAGNARATGGRLDRCWCQVLKLFESWERVGWVRGSLGLAGQGTPTHQHISIHPRTQLVRLPPPGPSSFDSHARSSSSAARHAEIMIPKNH